MPHVSRDLVESVGTLAIASPSAGRSYLEQLGQLPQAIYPEIRVLTANKATGNSTYYPEASLRGEAANGTGLISFVRPYPVPIIKDHNMGGGLFGGEPSDVYGRIEAEPQFVWREGTGYIQANPKITHPTAIEAILSGRWLTVSLGSRVDGVNCSICNQDLTDPANDCEHDRGETYDVQGVPQRALWIIGAVRAKEVSFVLQPSDDEAGVLNPNAPMAESVKRTAPLRCLVPLKGGIVDLATGRPAAFPGAHLLARERRTFAGLSLRLAVEGKPAPCVCESDRSGAPERAARERGAPEDDRPLTLADLFLLPADDPDAQSTELPGEAKLSTAARKKLPDSAFCGPNRSFPAHDKAHVTAGLRLLGRATLSSAEKSRVRACLIRKGKALGMTFDKESMHAAVLVDRAHRVEVHLYPLPTSEEELQAVLAQVGQMPHTPEEKAQIVGRIAKAAEGFLDDAAWLTLFGEQPTEASETPVTIEINGDNYALLYRAAELAPEADAPAAAPAESAPAETVPVETAEAAAAETAAAETAETAPAAAETTATETEAPADAAETAEAAPAAVEAAVPAAPIVEAGRIKTLETIAREALAHTVALYQRSLRKPQARDRSQSELVAQLQQRTLESLQDAVADLAAEWEAAPDAVIPRLPVIADPTLPDQAAAEQDRVPEAAEISVPAERARLSEVAELPLEEDEAETIQISFLSELFPELA
jgi:hypothetical protein